MVLLAGLPSKLAYIQQLVQMYVPLSPSRIVPMHHHYAGNWYPYQDEKGHNPGVIVDPKSPVVVGAAIEFMARHGMLPQFKFEMKGKTKENTYYWGVMTDATSGIRKERILFEPAEEQAREEITEFSTSSQRVIIGRKMNADEDAQATPVYVLKMDAGDRIGPTEVTVKIKRKRATGRGRGEPRGGIGHRRWWPARTPCWATTSSSPGGPWPTSAITSTPAAWTISSWRRNGEQLSGLVELSDASGRRPPGSRQIVATAADSRRGHRSDALFARRIPATPSGTRSRGRRRSAELTAQLDRLGEQSARPATAWPSTSSAARRNAPPAESAGGVLEKQIAALAEKLDRLAESGVAKSTRPSRCRPLPASEQAIRPLLAALQDAGWKALTRQTGSLAEGLREVQTQLGRRLPGNRPAARPRPSRWPSRSPPRGRPATGSGRSSARDWPPMPNLAFQRQQLLTGVLDGDAGACSLAGQLLVFQSAPAERLPQLLKDIGEAYYRWQPKTRAGHQSHGRGPGGLAAAMLRPGGHFQHDRAGPPRRAVRRRAAQRRLAGRGDHRRPRLDRAAGQRQGLHEGHRGREIIVLVTLRVTHTLTRSVRSTLGNPTMDEP